MCPSIRIDRIETAARAVAARQSNLHDTGRNVLRFAGNHSHRPGQQSIVLRLLVALAVRLGEIGLC